MTGDVGEILKNIALVITAVSGLVASLAALRTGKRAEQTAKRAEDAATTAHAKASEAVREQINFALKRSAKQAVQELAAQGNSHE
jgi:hypothetical protein